MAQPEPPTNSELVNEVHDRDPDIGRASAESSFALVEAETLNMPLASAQQLDDLRTEILGRIDELDERVTSIASMSGSGLVQDSRVPSTDAGAVSPRGVRFRPDLVDDDSPVGAKTAQPELMPAPRSSLRQSSLVSAKPSFKTSGTSSMQSSRSEDRSEDITSSFSTSGISSGISAITVFGQARIARTVPLPLRILGVGLGFVTVVFLWEATDLAISLATKDLTHRLIYYLLILIMSAIGLALSHQWIFSADSTLVPSFAYALCTLWLAIGSWGILYCTVGILVQKKGQLFVWIAGGVVCLAGSVLYALQTKHNVILDIASCATSLGLEEGEESSLLMSTAPKSSYGYGGTSSMKSRLED